MVRLVAASHRFWPVVNISHSIKRGHPFDWLLAAQIATPAKSFGPIIHSFPIFTTRSFYGRFHSEYQHGTAVSSAPSSHFTMKRWYSQLTTLWRTPGPTLIHYRLMKLIANRLLDGPSRSNDGEFCGEAGGRRMCQFSCLRGKMYTKQGHNVASWN